MFCKGFSVVHVFRLNVIIVFLFRFGGAFLLLKSNSERCLFEFHSRPMSRLNSFSEDAVKVQIKNFRQAFGVPGLYRCAETDSLAKVIEAGDDFDEDASLVFKDVGLILDLRSASERDESSARRWMEKSGFNVMENVDEEELKDKTVLRIDVLSPTRLFEYLNKFWLTPSQQALSAIYFATNIRKRNELQMSVLNSRGLAGLYEAIVQTSGNDICFALRTLTLHFENNNSPAVVHCVQGKDR